MEYTRGWVLLVRVLGRLLSWLYSPFSLWFPSLVPCNFSLTEQLLNLVPGKLVVLDKKEDVINSTSTRVPFCCKRSVGKSFQTVPRFDRGHLYSWPIHRSPHRILSRTPKRGKGRRKGGRSWVYTTLVRYDSLRQGLTDTPRPTDGRFWEWTQTILVLFL